MLIALTNTTTQKFLSFGPCTIRGLSGQNNKTDSYIQLHQKLPDTIATPLATGNVPIFKSMFCPSGFAFGFRDSWFGRNGVYFSSLVLGISSTEPAFTDAGANNGLDLTIELDTEYAPNGTEAIAGDLTTGRDDLAIWTDTHNASTGANDNYRLLTASYTNNAIADRYLLASADGGTTQMAGWCYKVATGVTITLDAGISQQAIRSIDPDFDYHYGLKLIQSTTPLLAGATAATDAYIKALYRSSQY